MRPPSILAIALLFTASIATALVLSAYSPMTSANPLPGTTGVAAGRYHTCLISVTVPGHAGRTQCWGLNANGQVGDGTTTSRTSAVDVLGLGSDSYDIAAGADHSCAATVTGGMKCWGSNAFGQLGDGTTAESAAPVQVSGLTDTEGAIAAGTSHTCASDSTTGAIWCWGNNSSGQLGDGTTIGHATPVEVAGPLVYPRDIVAGAFHTCVLTDDRRVLCWGDNSAGQLGDGTTLDSAVPVEVTGLETDILALDAGGNHTCVATISRSVKCWGSNAYGELGDGQACGFVCSTPVDVSGLSDVTAIAAGGDHTCAVNTSAVFCWGQNDLGQLGDGTTTDRTTPTTVTGFDAGALAVAAGESHTCAFSNTVVRCWGDNAFGQLGNGAAGTRTAPVEVAGLAGVTAADAGANHTCARTAAGGIACWGDNDTGELGDGTTIDRSTPVDVTGLTNGAAAVSAGDDFTCALTAAGAVKCWGFNPDGNLGNGTTDSSTTPIDVLGRSSGVTAIAVGGRHTCGITTGGGVTCWGWNHSGQMGDGTTIDRHTAINVPGLGSGIAALASGSEHSCALAHTGGLLCWGLNADGQLGDGTTADRATPGEVTGLAMDVAAVAAGSFHTCAITTSGGLKCWGDNSYGQLGDGTTIDRSVPVGVTGLASGVAAVAAGGGHTCALTTAGGVLCWGRNLYGQLGDGSYASRSTPVPVAGLASGVAAITAGTDHTCAVMSSGGLVCWGNDFEGELGDGTIRYSTSPIAVISSKETPTPTSTVTPPVTPTPTRTATPAGIPGDADCNRRADAIDSAVILQLGAGLLASLPCPANADVDGRNGITAIDAALILQYVAGLIAHLPP